MTHHQAMVAASQPLAVDAGLDVLRRGGNAIDAAIATNAVLALTEPTGCGLGGDLFTLFWSAADKQLHAYDGAGRSPKNLQLDTLQQNGDEIPATGPLPVSVPGCVEAWGKIHGQYGQLPWSQLFEHAIEHAQRGFTVTPVIGDLWRRGSTRLADQPGFTETFLPAGRAPRPGELFRNPGLSMTLDRIAQQGWQEFYEGTTANRLTAFCKQQGCALNSEDLSAHQGNWVKTVSSDYRGLEVHQLPPPGQGACVLQLLNLLETLGHHELKPDSPEAWHLFIEAKKLVFADRARWYGDPDFNEIPISTLLSKKYASDRAQLIDRHRARQEVASGNAALSTSDTVYLTTADSDGNMVSWIQSNYMGFGSGLCPEGLGFGLQNRGRLFVLNDPTHPNLYAPAKKPFHTIIPGFVLRESKPWLSFGVMGGDYQPVGQTRILQLIHDQGLGIQEAGDQPRLHHVGSASPTGTSAATDGGRVLAESSVSDNLLRALEKLGHHVERAESLHFGGYQAISRDPYGYRGASESRKDGRAVGC